MSTIIISISQFFFYSRVYVLNPPGLNKKNKNIYLSGVGERELGGRKKMELKGFEPSTF